MKRLNEQVRRNAERFPADFMFQLSPNEREVWRSQAVISNPGAKMGLRRAPFVFTEHGALMAASLLNSPRAIETSLYVVRAFVRASSGKGDGSISTGNQVSTRGSVEKWQHWRPRSGPIRSFVAEPRKLAA